MAAQPIVIFGGFLSFTMLYWGMRDVLESISGQPVWPVETWSHDWLPSFTRLGWAHLLRKLEDTVQQAAAESPTGKVTLIGHSAGGVLARLYLSPNPFLGYAYRGIDYVNHLITLGSPHYNQGSLKYGGQMSRWVEQRCPGACYAPQVKYTSVAGKLVRGDRQGSLQERWAYNVYAEIGGDGNAWGDGLIPLESALLHGSHQVVLDDIGHFSGFGRLWYGSQDMIPLWWNAAGGDDERDSQRPTRSDA
jgi:pimeloyl-ACP methyl ester carboxylesterase